MTKQQKTYLLLVAVLIIWGIIGYQFLNQLNPKQENTAIVESSKKYIPKNIEKGKPYVIKADYRDPFLGKTVVSNKKKKIKQKPLKKEILIPFPKVIYNGIVEGSTKSYTITINGKQELLKIGESFQDIKLVKANNEEITVTHNNITKTIKLH